MNIRNNKPVLAPAIFTFSLLLSIAACKEEPPVINPPANETELITTMVLEFEDSFLFKKTYAVFRDADGPGGNAPSKFDTIRLTTNRPYITRIFLLDESKSPVDTVSNQVYKEANDHLFVFTPSGVSINVKAEDTDDKGLPLGMFSIWRTGNASTGKMKVALKHQPGIKDGSADKGETDVEIDFHCIIN
jgi:hypothetical protein